MQGSPGVQQRLVPWLLVQPCALLRQGPPTCLMCAGWELQGGVPHLPLYLRPHDHAVTAHEPGSRSLTCTHARMQSLCLHLVASAG